MDCLIISCVYPPEPVVSAQTSAQIAKDLSKANHSVTVVTSVPNRPSGKLFSGVARKFAYREQVLSGVKVVRCFSTLSPKSNMLSRLSENLSFGLTGGLQALIAKRPQVIYANTWPIIATGILSLVAKMRNIPLVISVQDVYPETLVTQQRVASGSAMARFMGWVDGIIARHSAHVIVISKRFAEIYRSQRRVPPDQLSFVPNWIDADSIDIGTPTEQFRLKKGMGPKDFLLVYGGNIGVAASVETVIESMRYLTDRDNVRLLVAGGGSQLETCKALAAKITGNRVVFHSPWLLDETSEVLRSADVLLLPTQRAQSLVSVPSKLLSYMLAARPVLAMAVPESDVADLVTRSECGWVIEPDRPDLLAAKIKEVSLLESTELERRGNMGREYVLHHFTREACLPKVIQILEQAGGMTRHFMPGSSDTPSIRNMDICDVSSVVQVHLESFSGFFLSFLGPAFLRELYTATLAEPSGIGLVAENGEGICGFVTGTSQPSGFYSRLARRRWWRFGWAAVGPVLKRPLIISRLFRAFSMPEQATQEEGRGTLMSIAVLPAVQGKGIGQALVREFLETAVQRDLRRIDLTTDQTDNDATNHFYQNLGFTCQRTYTTPEGRVMNEYIIDVGAKASSDNPCQ